MIRPFSFYTHSSARRGITAALLVTATLCNASMTMAQPIAQTSEAAVVLASDAPDMAPGGVLDLRGSIKLAPGASVTLLLRSGEIIRLKGPFNGALADVAEPTRSGVSLYAEMLRLRGVDASSIGGTRALAHASPGVADLTAEVTLRSSERATYCISPGTSVWIDRPTGESNRYELRRAGMFRTVKFPDGATRAPWPDDVAVEDLDHFDLLRDGAAVASYVFRVRPTAPISIATIVATDMLDGCQGQVARLFAEMARKAAAGGNPSE